MLLFIQSKENEMSECCENCSVGFKYDDDYLDHTFGYTICNPCARKYMMELSKEQQALAKARLRREVQGRLW